MKSIEIKYFGLISEHVGKIQEVRETKGETIADLKRELESEHFMLGGLPYRIAQNRKLVQEDSLIESGDELAFMPPFAGG